LGEADKRPVLNQRRQVRHFAADKRASAACCDVAVPIIQASCSAVTAVWVGQINEPRHPMPRLPNRYAPFLFALVQAAVTTGLATAIATQQTTPFGLMFLMQWLSSWAIAWVVMVPVVLMAAPVITRSIAALTERGGYAGPKA